MYLTELVTLDRKITTEVAHPKEAKSEDNCSQKQIHDSDENTTQAQVRNSEKLAPDQKPT